MILTDKPAPTRRSRLGGITLLALGLALTAAPLGLMSRPAAAGAGPLGFFAIYQISFLGLTLGKAKVRGNLNGETYGIQGETKLSFLKGLLFELSLGGSASGQVAAGGPRPAQFVLQFVANKEKKGRLSMGFRDGAVSHVATHPPIDSHPGRIPVAQQHLRGVLDPLTGMFLTGNTERNGLDPTVCNRRLPIFDGRHRFDVQLSYIQTVSIKRRGRNGYAGLAVVCGAAYVPISGHRPENEGVAHMSTTKGIRVWLIPVPQAKRVLPYRVVLPTPWGEASATAKLIQLDWGGKKVALVR